MASHSQAHRHPQASRKKSLHTPKVCLNLKPMPHQPFSARLLQGKMSQLGARVTVRGRGRKKGTTPSRVYIQCSHHASPLFPEACLGWQHVTWFVCVPIYIWISVCPQWVTSGEKEGDCGAETIKSLLPAGRWGGIGQQSCLASPLSSFVPPSALLPMSYSQ